MIQPIKNLIRTWKSLMDEPILEIGSRIVECNSNFKTNKEEFFPDADYTGLDLQDGRGVDVVADAENIPYPNGHFNTVLCFETLEHTKNPFKIMKEADRVLNENGMVLITAPFQIGLHDYPADYWRFTDEGLCQLLDGYRIWDKGYLEAGRLNFALELLRIKNLVRRVQCAYVVGMKEVD